MPVSKKELEKHIISFINEEKRPILLWGASHAGQICYRWLDFYGKKDQVVAFLDSNAALEGKKINDIPIMTPEKGMQAHRDAVVIISTQFHAEVYKRAKAYIADIYFFENRLPAYYNGETHPLPTEELLNLYQNDPKSRLRLEICDLLIQYNFSAVFPYKVTEEIPLFHEYWDEEDLTLDRYSAFTLIDCGAFIGDTIEFIHKKYPTKEQYYYAFEPSPTIYQTLLQTVERLGIQEKVQTFNAGVSDASGKAYFTEDSFASRVGEGEETIELLRLDDLSISPKGKLCIKMDIEGSEMAALQGAAQLIKTYKPELAICVYHKYDDIYDIPAYLRSIVPEYRFLLRGGPHMECYASVDRF